MELNPEQKAEIRAQLAKILASPYFQGQERPSQILSWVVTRALDGLETTEADIGAEFYGAKFTGSKGDVSAVRAIMSSVRTPLFRFNGREGRKDDWLIEIIPGKYTPDFEFMPTLGSTAHSHHPNSLLNGFAKYAQAITSPEHSISIPLGLAPFAVKLAVPHEGHASLLAVEFSIQASALTGEHIATLLFRYQASMIIEFRCSDDAYEQLKNAFDQGYFTGIHWADITEITTTSALYLALALQRSPALLNCGIGPLSIAELDDEFSTIYYRFSTEMEDSVPIISSDYSYGRPSSIKTIAQRIHLASGIDILMQLTSSDNNRGWVAGHGFISPDETITTPPNLSGDPVFIHGTPLSLLRSPEWNAVSVEIHFKVLGGYLPINIESIARRPNSRSLVIDLRLHTRVANEQRSSDEHLDSEVEDTRTTHELKRTD
jgi:hypothetical protein